MSPLLLAPSDEVVELARALIRDPHATPHCDDGALRAAAAAVAAAFDDFDEHLIAQVANEPADSKKRGALELAIAHRIVRAQLAVDKQAE